MRSKILVVMVLVAALISCKAIDAVKKRVMAAAASSASAGALASAAASPAAPAAPAGGKAIPAPSRWKIAALAVGQHARYRVKRAPGSVSTVEYKIIGKKGAAYWMEVDDRRAGRRTTMLQILLSIPDRTNPKTVDIQGVRVKMGGRVQELHGAMMRAIEKGATKYLGTLAVPGLEGKPQQDKTVPAGTFKGCYVWKAREKFAGMTEQGTHWSHPAVPIMALVKSELHDGTTVELLDYGMSGAKTGF